MSITHSFTSAKSDGGDATLIKPSDWNAAHTIDYLEMPEGSAPSTPASGKARIYIKTDGRVYSKDDAGVEYGPFDVAGTSLSSFRLSGVRDDPNDVPLGTYGDEIEYASDTAFDAVWTTRGTGATSTIAGSSVILRTNSATPGSIAKSAASFASTYEVAFLVSMHNDNAGMNGITLCNSSGNGYGFSPYSDGNSYQWHIAGGVYSSTGASGTGYTAWQDGRPVWFAVRFNGTNYRFRRSEDGTTWTTLVTATLGAVSGLSEMRWARHFAGGTAASTELIHRVIYGTPDLGL